MGDSKQKIHHEKEVRVAVSCLGIHGMVWLFLGFWQVWTKGRTQAICNQHTTGYIIGISTTGNWMATRKPTWNYMQKKKWWSSSTWKVNNSSKMCGKLPPPGPYYLTHFEKKKLKGFQFFDVWMDEELSPNLIQPSRPQNVNQRNLPVSGISTAELLRSVMKLVWNNEKVQKICPTSRKKSVMIVVYSGICLKKKIAPMTHKSKCPETWNCW